VKLLPSSMHPVPWRVALRVAFFTVVALSVPTAVAAQSAVPDSVGNGPAEAGIGTPGIDFAIDVERAPRPSAFAVRTEEPIRVDGQLDEGAWLDAPVIDRFIQSQPLTGFQATERTEVMILYGDDALYVGARLYESDPSRSTLLTLERDFPGASTRDSDIFAITLDTFLDRRNSFIFLVNPRGALRDGQTFDDSRNQDFAWRGAVEVETVQAEWGWTLEMAIPWSALRFDPTVDELHFGNEPAAPGPVEERGLVLGTGGSPRSGAPYVPRRDAHGDSGRLGWSQPPGEALCKRRPLGRSRGG